MPFLSAVHMPSGVPTIGVMSNAGGNAKEIATRECRQIIFSDEGEPTRALVAAEGDPFIKEAAPNEFFTLLPCPNPKNRHVINVNGCSGSGKSTWTAAYADSYRRCYPKRPQWLISRVSEDKILDTLREPPKRLDVAKLVADPILDIKDLLIDADGELQDGALLIADDADTFPKASREVVAHLLDSVAEMGRHHSITMLVCTHRHVNGRATSLLLTEVTHIVVFGASMNASQLRYLLERTVGMDMAQIRELRFLKGRATVLQKTHPQLVISDKAAYLLNQEHNDLERIVGEAAMQRVAV